VSEIPTRSDLLNERYGGAEVNLVTAA
jgi:hypothetical protein